MEHIQKSGMDFDPRLAFHYISSERGCQGRYPGWIRSRLVHRARDWHPSEVTRCPTGHVWACSLRYTGYVLHDGDAWLTSGLTIKWNGSPSSSFYLNHKKMGNFSWHHKTGQKCRALFMLKKIRINLFITLSYVTTNVTCDFLNIAFFAFWSSTDDMDKLIHFIQEWVFPTSRKQTPGRTYMVSRKLHHVLY